MQKILRGLAAILLVVLIVLVSITALKWFIKVILFFAGLALIGLLYAYLKRTGGGSNTGTNGPGTEI